MSCTRKSVTSMCYLQLCNSEFHQAISYTNVDELSHEKSNLVSYSTNAQVISHIEDTPDIGTAMAVVDHDHIASEQKITTNEVVLPLPTDGSLPGDTVDAILQSYVERIYFQDVLGRKYDVPFEKCKT
jgi:hypothetical protein